MGLEYSAVINSQNGSVISYEATPWFGGLAEDPNERETIADVEEQLCRIDLVTDMSFYFLYEAADALLRIENCKFDLEAIVLHMIPSFYKQGAEMQRFQKLWKDQPIDKTKLVLTIPQEFYLALSNPEKDTVKRYLGNGFSIMLDGWNAEAFSAKDVLEAGFTHVRIAADSHLKHETADAIAELEEKGKKVAVFDLARDDMAEAVEDSFKYSKLVLATTTYNGSIFPYMNTFIETLVEHNYQNRTVAFIENGTWAPIATKLMKGKLENCKNLRFTENGVKIFSSVNQTNVEEIKALAEELK
jgi:hypothetical protein